MIPLLMIGTGELLVIGATILLLFGGKKIPELMRSLGQGVKNFKEGMNSITEPAEKEESSNSPSGKVAPKESTKPSDEQKA